MTESLSYLEERRLVISIPSPAEWIAAILFTSRFADLDLLRSLLRKSCFLMRSDKTVDRRSVDENRKFTCRDSGKNNSVDEAERTVLSMKLEIRFNLDSNAPSYFIH